MYLILLQSLYFVLSKNNMSVNKLARDKKRWYFSFYYEGKKYKKEVWNGEPMLSKTEATQAEYECRQQLEKQKAMEQGDMTLYELYDDFVSKTKSNLKVSSKKNYITFKKNYLPLIPNKKIHSLTPTDIANWKERINNIDMEYISKNKILNIMKSMLDYGLKIYDLKGRIQLPLLEKFKEQNIIVDDGKSKFIIEDDFITMLSYLDLNVDSDFYYYVIYNLIYYTGIRIGELTALTLDDYVDSTLTINKDYVRIGGVDYIQPPKSEKSNRKIILDEDTNKLLKDYLSRFKPTKIIFHRNKKYLSQQRVREKLSQIAQASEMDLKYVITPHTLRHSHSSNLRKLGFDEIAISDRLGNDPSVAIKTYTHAEATEQQEIAQKLRKK